jgi:5-methylcytosine-specific restriction endonuclease McrA
MSNRTRQLIIKRLQKRGVEKFYCPICQELMYPFALFRNDFKVITVDHIVAKDLKLKLKLKNTDLSHTRNIRLVCRECNEIRGTLGHSTVAAALCMLVARQANFNPRELANTWAKNDVTIAHGNILK